MRFKISISAEVDFTEMLQPENVEGAKLALGASNEAELIKKFSENILVNTQSYTSSFNNIGNVVGDISRIEPNEPPQAEQQAQETDDNTAQQEVDFRETMRKIREYQEQQQQHQDAVEEDLGEVYQDDNTDNSPLSQEELVEHYEEDEPIEYYEGEEIDLVDNAEKRVTHRIDDVLRNIMLEGRTIDSIAVNSLELKEHIINSDEIVINKDSIIVREDLETDFVIRYMNETNNIVEVV